VIHITDPQDGGNLVRYPSLVGEVSPVKPELCGGLVQLPGDVARCRPSTLAVVPIAAP